jgi:hypothetical protein
MFNVGQDWNPKHTQLKQCLKAGKLEEAKELLCDLHSLVHTSKVYNMQSPTYMDEIWDGISENVFRTAPAPGDTTIAWNIWHVTRIEDITSNILIADCHQVLDELWLEKLNTAVKDTGNAMGLEEILAFSNEVNMAELRNYRDSVGVRTKEIIGNLTKDVLKNKFSQSQMDRILVQGGVTEHPDSL